ncbi:MAG: hypothetical protein K6E91_15070 [Butyrivibrio sp.]|nr:hypothetical protein [Butyrivibrio sp.]
MGLKAPDHTTGSPMMDIMETAGSIQLAAIHRQYFKGNDDEYGDERYLAVDMICAEEEVKDFRYALGSNTLVFDVTDQKTSIINGFSISGATYTPGQEYPIGEYDWQFVLKSELEKNPTEKEAAVRIVFNADTEPDLNKILTIYGGFVSKVSDDGQGSEDADTVEEIGSDAYHVFRQDADGYSYGGSVKQKAEGQYDLLDNVVAISAYHYVLAQGVSEEGNPILVKRKLEDIDGITQSFFAVDGEGDNKLRLNDNIMVVENVAPADQDHEDSGLMTAYALDIGGNEATVVE